MTSNIKAAMRYARNDMDIFPIHEIGKDGYCTCNRGMWCNSPGKHPKTKKGSLEATHDAKQIKKWWKKWPDANIGWRLGDKYAAIDIDEGQRTKKKVEKL